MPSMSHWLFNNLQITTKKIVFNHRHSKVPSSKRNFLLWGAGGGEGVGDEKSCLNSLPRNRKKKFIVVVILNK